MEDEIFKGQQSLREKTTLLFTFAFEKLVSGMFKGTSGLLKVDVAFTKAIPHRGKAAKQLNRW